MTWVRRAVLASLTLAMAAAFGPAPTAIGDGAGAQVSGVVTQVDTGSPLANVEVCVEAVAPEEGGLCAVTDTEGSYAVVGIPAGTYIVAFGVETQPGGGRTAAQWWNGASAPAQATQLAMAPPQVFTGINGQVGASAAARKPNSGGGTVVVPGPQATPSPELTPQRCKKGYRWRKVHGVKRCVPKPKHHRRQHRPNAG